MTLEVAGHIAEVGVAMGAGSLLFGKLTKLFEPNSLTLVYDFDWFKGAVVTPEEWYVKDGECQVDEELVRRLIRVQGLENIVHLHNLDVTTQLAPFVVENDHLMFKLVFLDAGIHSVVSESIRQFWSRMTPGGILILDHYDHEFAPGETRAVRELLPEIPFKQFPFGWMPATYAIKK